jgi:hypothetical protein
MIGAPSTPLPSAQPSLRRELKGNVKDMPMAVILQAVRERKLTGELSFLRDGDAVSLQLLAGEIIFANSNDPATRLGEWLLMRGKINVAQYEESGRLVKETGDRQGTVLLRMGLIGPLELERAVRQQVGDIVFGLFNWSSGEYRFSPQDPREEHVSLDISLVELIIKGAGQLRNWPLIQRGLSPFTDILEIDRKFNLEEARRVRLSREEDSILHLVDGKRSIDEIGAVSPFPLYPTFRTIYAFKAAHVLRRKKHVPR